MAARFAELPVLDFRSEWPSGEGCLRMSFATVPSASAKACAPLKKPSPDFLCADVFDGSRRIPVPEWATSLSPGAELSRSGDRVEETAGAVGVLLTGPSRK